jgi:hypothetical protein
MKPYFLLFATSLFFIVDSFAQKTILYPDVGVMKITHGHEFRYFEDVNVEWKDTVNNVDYINKIFFDTFSFRIIKPFEYQSGQIGNEESRPTFLSEAVDTWGNLFDAGLVRRGTNEFLFTIWRRGDYENGILFLLVLQSGRETNSDLKSF